MPIVNPSTFAPADNTLLGLLAASSGSSIVGTIAAGAGAVARTQQAKNRDIVSVKDFGAVGDGVADDRGAIALAVAACKTSGQSLYFPAGQYLINSDGGSITLEEVGLVGDYVLDGATATIDKGSVLRFTGTTNSPFLVRRGVGFRSLGFFYPNQVDSATPTAYPPTLDFDFTNGAVQFVYAKECVVYNAYRFCRINNAAGSVGHCWFEDNTIYGINRCFEITRNVETLHFKGNDFTFGHWLAATEAGCRAYTRLNGYVIQYDYGDGIYVSDNLFFGYLRGLSMGAGGVLVQLCRFNNNSFDNIRYPYYCTGAGNFYSLKMVGNDYNAVNTQNTALDSNVLFMDNSGASVDVIDFTGDEVAQVSADGMLVSGAAPTRIISVTGGHWRGIAGAKAAGNYHAFNVSGALTTLQLTGVYVRGAYTAFTNGIGGALNVLKTTGCTFEGFQNVYRSVTANIVSHIGNSATATQGATSDVITATTNLNVGNNYDKPSGTTTRCAFTVRKNAAQTTVGTTPLTVTFATTTYDKGTNFSSPTFTAPFAGRYRFEWALMHDNTGTAADRFTINLTTSAAGTSSVSYKMIADYNSVTGSGEFDMAAGGTLTLIVTRVGGTGVFNTFNDGTANWLSGALVE